jgi:succinyl-diaminopimelate desuccinylase
MDLKILMKQAEAATDEVAELTSDLVKFNSAHPEGYTDEAVEYIKTYLDKYSIENEIHSDELKKPNIVARVKGIDKKKVLWVGHIDVVPEGKPENWTYPPFSGTIYNTYVWGRGRKRS